MASYVLGLIFLQSQNMFWFFLGFAAHPWLSVLSVTNRTPHQEVGSNRRYTRSIILVPYFGGSCTATSIALTSLNLWLQNSCKLSSGSARKIVFFLVDEQTLRHSHTLVSQSWKFHVKFWNPHHKISFLVEYNLAYNLGYLFSLMGIWPHFCTSWS